MQSYDFSKVDLKPKRHHGFSVLLFILGTLFPPLAVAARFGIGTDFWLNLLLTICGYIPGHVHNFYIQNIRNNKNNNRTPKWAQRYGLVDTSEIKRKQKRSQWAGRYSERNPHSALEGQPYAEGELPDPEGTSLENGSTSGIRRSATSASGNQLWSPAEEQYYGRNGDGSSTNSGGRWHYPANFEDAAPASGTLKKKKKVKKDRWARTEDAYSLSEEQTHKKKKKKRVNHSTVGGAYDEADGRSNRSDSTNGFPEDPEGGLYGDRRTNGRSANGNGNTNGNSAPADDDAIFEHQF
ncbi:hypothetical protein EVG20_g1814 [Dentipellis fragilis]|uniref:Stress response RCI peptide n=1 Tax=Dentipellis fragilis TaxID=205917 RepID=A0A4Y9Z8K3_9AGAM|nr:hypothetical protein EVG20_g1814 [Dentipellis fragilis]